ncbi:methyltransferase domain-containing protein [Arthrobacter sp. CDRTa11]|uniref:methyltransferase domain-containing protein n=1 Tax=Arthrobacter sp. CDRTa11 TaxID=2651199 RepID=UPI002265B149|nr:methyltransferase domain-containing protein [Arthrobacter sp. CDRTa11]UZX03466.1 methyltransferase domain-containing protein [Arthrobacter sp. CDRTa11]
MPISAPLPLLCPVCRAALDATGDGGPAFPAVALRCGAGHSFDAAKQGYFNLLVGKGTVFESDTAEMVAARFNFLEGGHYRPLAEAVAAAAAPHLAGSGRAVVDSGTGTGHYLRQLLDTVAPATTGLHVIALDISKYALRRAARLNPEAVNLACDVWQPLPVADSAVDVVTVIFAPRNAAEFARILRPAGRLVVVTPRAGHLAAVRAETGMLGIEADKDDRLAEAMSGHFDVESAQDLDIPMTLTPTEVADLAFMGPAGHHLNRAGLIQRLSGLAPMTAVEARFRITVLGLAGRPG